MHARYKSRLSARENCADQHAGTWTVTWYRAVGTMSRKEGASDSQRVYDSRWWFLFTPINTTNRSHPLPKGDADAKYWLEVASFQVIEAHAYDLNPRISEACVGSSLSISTTSCRSGLSSRGKTWISHDIQKVEFIGTTMLLQFDGKNTKSRFQNGRPTRDGNAGPEGAIRGVSSRIWAHWPNVDEICPLTVDWRKHAAPAAETTR